jgi:hypothetical protein
MVLSSLARWSIWKRQMRDVPSTVHNSTRTAIGISALLNIAQPFKDMAVSIYTTRRELSTQLDGVDISAALSAGEISWHTLADELIFVRDNVEAHPDYQVIQQLHEWDALPRAEKRDTLLFIPQSNQAYWGLAPSGFNLQQHCRVSPLLAPALSGMALVDGLRPVACGEERYYGYALYPIRTEPQALGDRESLCEQVQARGFSQVLIVDSDEHETIISRLFMCS